jgi:hypothetical protein
MLLAAPAGTSPVLDDAAKRRDAARKQAQDIINNTKQKLDSSRQGSGDPFDRLAGGSSSSKGTAAAVRQPPLLLSEQQ